MKPKRQLELEAAVAEAASALAALKADTTYITELTRLGEANKATITAADAARDATRAYERAYLVERQIIDNSGAFTPCLLAQAAEIIGVHYDEQSTVQPGNKRDSIYKLALAAIQERVLAQAPRRNALREAQIEASRKNNDACSALYDHRRKLVPFEKALNQKHSELQEYMDSRQARMLLRGDEAKGDGGEAKRLREARVKIAEIIAGTIKLPLEG